MTTDPDLQKVLTEKTDQQLYDMLAQADDYRPEALEAARQELRNRNLDPNQHAHPENTAAPQPQEIDDLFKQVLVELRRQTRFNEISACIAIGALVLGIAYVVWRSRQFPRPSRLGQQIERLQRQERASPASAQSQESCWSQIDTALELGDFKTALSVARTMTKRTPASYYAYSYLGHVYLTMGDLTNAEAQFTRAYELYPTEDQEKPLTAVRKRLARERGAQSPAN